MVLLSQCFQSDQIFIGDSANTNLRNHLPDLWRQLTEPPRPNRFLGSQDPGPGASRILTLAGAAGARVYSQHCYSDVALYRFCVLL